MKIDSNKIKILDKKKEEKINKNKRKIDKNIEKKEMVKKFI